MEKIYEIVRIKQEVSKTREERFQISSPEDVNRYAYDLIGEDDREVFLVMVLNTKNHVVAVHRCHVGSLSASIIHPREVFKSAILNNGAGIIGIHQHPSGDPKPSREDLSVCERLEKAGRILGIELIDFCVLGENARGEIAYVSMREEGNL